MPKQKSQLLEFFSLMDVWYPSKKQYFVHYRKKFLLCYICEYILKKNTKETLQMPSFGGVLKDLNQSQPLQEHHNYIYLRRQFRFNFMYIATIPLFVDWRPNTSQHWLMSWNGLRPCKLQHLKYFICHFSSFYKLVI